MSQQTEARDDDAAPTITISATEEEWKDFQTCATVGLLAYQMIDKVRAVLEGQEPDADTCHEMAHRVHMGILRARLQREIAARTHEATATPPPSAADPRDEARETWHAHRLVCRECKTGTCQRGHHLLYEYAKTLTPAEPDQKLSFFAHLDDCDHCRANVHRLCDRGETALIESAAVIEQRERAAA